MAKESLQEIIMRAKSAPDDSRWTPGDGQKFPFKVVSSNTSTYKEHPSWSAQLECTKGEDKGRRAWCSLSFNPEHDFINQRTLRNLACLGVTDGQVVSVAPSVVAEMLIGTTGVAIAKVRPSDNPTRPYVDFELEPSRRVIEVEVEAAVDEGDSLNGATAEEPKKKKKKKKKVKVAAVEVDAPDPDAQYDEDEDDWDS